MKHHQTRWVEPSKMKISGRCNITGKHPLAGGFNILFVVKKMFGIRVPADIFKRC